MKREPLLIWSSILVGLQILTGGAVLGDVIGAQFAGLAILVVAAMQGGTQFYIRGQVTANDNVAARLTPDGRMVAGTAASVPNNREVVVVQQH